MVKSMTGYGRATGATQLGEVQVELRSVNSKYLDLKVKTPRFLFSLEPLIQKEMKARVGRGRVECSVNLNSMGASPVQLKINENLAGAYLQAAEVLKSRFTVSGEASLELLLRLPDVISLEETQIDPEDFWKDVLPVLRQALEDFSSMREREGFELQRELEGRVELLRQLSDQVDEHRQESITLFRDRIAERMKDLLEGADFDQSRLLQEVAFLAERSDITEEVVRLRSHLDQLDLLLQSTESSGRQMDFLLQEMFREINTIGSKTELLSITQLVLLMKTEVDKLREQVQNIE